MNHVFLSGVEQNNPLAPEKYQNLGSWREGVLRDLSGMWLPKHTPGLTWHLNILCWNFCYSCQNLFYSKIQENTLMCNNQEHVIFFKCENFVKMKMHLHINICCQLCISTLWWSCTQRAHDKCLCSTLRRHVWVHFPPTWQKSFFLSWLPTLTIFNSLVWHTMIISNVEHILYLKHLP